MLSGIDHVNLVVADLEAMVRFYRDQLGLTVAKRVTIQGDWVDAVVGLRGAVGDVVYLEFPTGPRLELIHYRSPAGGRPEGLEISNTHGIRHLAFRVERIAGVVEKLRAAGIEFLSDVQRVPDDQVTYAGGVRKSLVYFRDPEGNLLELCEYR